MAQQWLPQTCKTHCLDCCPVTGSVTCRRDLFCASLPCASGGVELLLEGLFHDMCSGPGILSGAGSVACLGMVLQDERLCTHRPWSVPDGLQLAAKTHGISASQLANQKMKFRMREDKGGR